MKGKKSSFNFKWLRSARSVLTPFSFPFKTEFERVFSARSRSRLSLIFRARASNSEAAITISEEKHSNGDNSCISSTRISDVLTWKYKKIDFQIHWPSAQLYIILSKLRSTVYAPFFLIWKALQFSRPASFKTGFRDKIDRWSWRKIFHSVAATAVKNFFPSFQLIVHTAWGGNTWTQTGWVLFMQKGAFESLSCTN